MQEGSWLRCFGTLQLRGAAEGKVTSKHLLLLAYVVLEGPRSRFELAQLFWSHLAGSYTPKGERKDLGNLGVARAVLRRELGVDIADPSQLAALSCDVRRFEVAVEQAAFEAALDLYRQGAFLGGIEDKPRLKLGAELYGWLEEKRTRLAALACEALTQLAQKPETREKALSCAEELFRSGRLSSDLSLQGLALQGRLYGLLTQLGSSLSAEAQAAFTVLADERLKALSPEALELYLALSLQDRANLAAAQVAAELSPKAGAVYAEELRSANLLGSANGPLESSLARHYFERHPEKQMPLLSRLREHTPTEQAYAVYHAVYTLNETFGGIGYWREARAAYAHKAAELIENGEFGAAAAVLGQFREAEQQSQQTPEPGTRFLHAYALERLSHYQEGLDVLHDVEQTPEILAISAALLARTANFGDAKVLAQKVRQLDSLDAANARTAWLRALALNTLGQIAYEENSLLEAEVYFAQATLQWALAGHPQRELGALMNRANSLEKLGHIDEARKVYEEVLEKCPPDDVLHVRTLLNLGRLYEDLGQWQQAHTYYRQAYTIGEQQRLEDRDTALAAAIHNNLGHTQGQLGHKKARTHLNYAAKLALRAGERLLYAVALSNLALIDRDLAKFAAALELFEQLGSRRELRHYGELYKEMLRARIAEAESAGDAKSLSFLRETLTLFCRRVQSPDTQVS